MSDKQQRENMRRYVADDAGRRLVASAEYSDDGTTVELDVRALFVCAEGPQKWVAVCLEGGDRRVALRRAFVRKVQRAVKRRAGLRCYYDHARPDPRLCFRFNSGSGAPDGAGLDLHDQAATALSDPRRVPHQHQFEPGEAVECVLADPAIRRAS
jgi:hypothetical protein